MASLKTAFNTSCPDVEDTPTQIKHSCVSPKAPPSPPFGHPKASKKAASKKAYTSTASLMPPDGVVDKHYRRI